MMNQDKHCHTFVSHSTKHILLLIGLLIATMSFGQVQTQKGVSYRYNGKNPRTPLPSVIIECDAATNTVISDSITGEFSITFQKLKMGDRIGLVKVKKREMMVFNQHAVDEWSIRNEPLTLILCDANEFENQKQNLINIGKREAKAKYDRQKAELEKQLEASQIDHARYEAELDTAWQELDRLHKHIDEYADLFARIDESEIDSLAQQAMDLFNRGQVDEAVKLFEQGNYLEKLKVSNRAIKQADQLIEAAEQGKAKAEKDREEQLQSLNAQIAAYKMQNEWEKAGALLKGLADELKTGEAYLNYAEFSNEQNNVDEAINYYKEALRVFRQSTQNGSKWDEFALSITLTNLASLYCAIQYVPEIKIPHANKQRFAESESMYMEALEITRRLVKDNPQFEPNLVRILCHLAHLYSATQRFAESESMYLEALEIQKRLTPKAYEHNLSAILINLSELYFETHRFVESDKMLQEALEIDKCLAKDNPKEYEPYLAITLELVAQRYFETRHFAESETLYLEAMEIHRRLAKDNPKKYEPNLASTLESLARLYSDSEVQRFTESEALYLEALEIHRRLAKATPKVYEPDLAMTLSNLANLYDDTQRFMESETMHLEALEIFRRLAKETPQTYEPDLAMQLLFLGSLYVQQEQYLKAIPVHEESIDFFRTLAQNNPTYVNFYESSLMVLAQLYLQQGQFLKAIPVYEESLAICRRIAQDNPEYKNDYIESLYWLIQLYPMTEEHEKYYEVNEEWLPILKAFYQEDVKKYQNDYSSSLGNQSFQCIFVKQFEKAEQYAREGLAIDPSKLFIQTNLAAALLFQGKYTEAEQIYSQYKAELKDSFLQDLNDFEAAGIIPEERKADVKKIRKLLSE